MVRLSDFDKIVFHPPKLFRFDKPLTKIVGFDSEADRAGNTFLYTTSDGTVITPDTLVETLFTQYPSTNFVVWNLKYESGAILKVFPRAVIKKLQTDRKVIFYHGIRKLEITYIPHKRLRIRHLAFAGRAIRFWDMSPFYGRVKLETAAKDYLGESKIDLDPELFTQDFIIEHYDEIVKYCVRDSSLTQRLAQLWIDTFQKTGIPVTSLYSEAAIAFTYFNRKADVITAGEFWDYNRRLVRYAFESYEGGKFECTARGHFTGHEYDISSAYPNEILNLVDVRGAHVAYSPAYRSDAVYGYLRVRIKCDDPAVHLPFGIFRKIRVYPMGEYYLTITKQEYDYVRAELPQVEIDIADGAWVIVSKKEYPYREIISELYALKSEWKSRDVLRSKNYKTVMNGYYGKMAQCLAANDGSYRAGIAWNPLYASVITANTRIAVTKMQNILGNYCLAVHTDSVISTVPLPEKLLGKGLGQFELVDSGDIVIVACGIYEINGQSALKGFRKYSISKMLKDNPDSGVITLRQRHVESWLQAMAQNHDVGVINVFSFIPKKLTLNCDTKRLWPSQVTSTDLLNTCQYSMPLVEYQDSIPKHWSKK